MKPPNENATRQGGALKIAKTSKRFVSPVENIKQEITRHLNAWGRSGNQYEARLARVKSDALQKRKGSR